MTEEMKREFLHLRREIIGAAFSGLNHMQSQAVLATEGPLLLLAGAGSGKTTVLINRIGNLVRFGRGSDTEEIPRGVGQTDLAFLRLYWENRDNPALQAAGAERAYGLAALDPVRPWEILAITFTNKAADELKHRLEAQLGAGAKDIWAMTFHAACVRILRRFIDRLGFDAGFTIYDTADSQSLIKRIVADLNLDDKSFTPRSVLGEIGRAKDALIEPRAYLETAEKEGDYRKRQIGAVYVEYAKRLRNADALDFDDLLFWTVKLLQNHGEVREHYRRQFRYVLIDEYQDTNNLQYLFASLLAGGRNNICVVGDDDQSIYKFRGATIQNILNFEQQYPGARTIRLEQNYRSSGHILAAANAVIRNNLGRKGKKLWTDSADGEKLIHHTAQDHDGEANYVARCILDHFGQGGQWGDHAVLYRMSALANQLEFAFKRNGIPYRVVGGTRFFDRAEIKDVLAYLSVVANPADDLRLLRVINVPARGIGQTSVERLREAALQSGQSVFDAIQGVEEIADLKRSAVKLKQFGAMLMDLREQAGTMALDAFYEYLLGATGYLAMLREKPEENAARIEHIQELKSNIVRYMEQNPEGSLKGFLDEIALYTDLDSLGEDSAGVTLMTMHSAKGLEFDQVYLVGLEEGIFPGSRAYDQEELEEERRLCYVAITRAKKRLHLVSANRRMLFGRTTANAPSRFLEEIPEETMDRTGERRGFADRAFDDEMDQSQHRPRRFSDPPMVEGWKKPKRAAATPPGGDEQILKAFQIGDMVEHKAFGQGLIVQVQPVGNDALIEVAFETVGTKRLMLKAAARHMRKV